MNTKRILSGLRLGLVSTISWSALGAASAQTAPQAAVPATPVRGMPPSATAASPPDQRPVRNAADQNGPATTDQPPVAGQDATQAGDITVTASRLSLSSYQQPTPVTIVGAEKLERDNRTDLASVLVELPAVGPSQSANAGLGTQSISSSTAGLALINLRSLGVARTLTLFDGVRVAPSAEGGGVDLNLLPSSLVERIDVVTGGASAAWGSDAVSGVVNVILNKRFSGFAVNVEGATNGNGARQQAKGEISFGTDIGPRAHLIVSGAYLYSPDRVIPTDTSWYRSQNLVNNPAYTPTNGQPRLIHAERVGMANATQGGLITSGPLRGTQFLENGRPAPFDFGNVSGTLSNGGTFANPVSEGQAQNLTVPLRGGQLFGYLSYDFGGGIGASFELNYGNTKTSNTSAGYVRSNNVAIRIDNPYLDPSIVARMQAAGITSFNLSTTNSNNLNVTDGSSLSGSSVGNYNADVGRTLFRQVVSLHGPLSFLGDWTWNADIQHSEVHRHTFINNNPIVARYNLATDAVRVTAANVGASGLPIGQIVCRSSLAAPTNGCLPLNVLGVGVADPAAIRYIQGLNDGTGSFSDIYFKQWTASAAMNGQPFSTWAGPVAIAMGVDYRRDAIEQTADPLQYARAYALSNRQPLNAAQWSIEGFGEINIPLIAGGIVKSFDINAAARWTDYSTSGQVVTWKFGAVSQLNDDIRVRGTMSRDIRAPGLVALFEKGSSLNLVVPDPFNNNAPANVTQLTSGNPDLKPEVARTYTAGLVLTPSWLPGLSASVDYYSIKIKDAFVTPLADQAIRECVAGNQNFCDLLQRNAAGALTTVRVTAVNAALEETAGFDVQVDYRLRLGGGRLDISANGNYTTKHKINSLGAVVDLLNSLNRAVEGSNSVRATVSATYSQERFSATVQTRFIGAAKLNNQWGPLDVDDNHVPAVAYLDLRGSYYVGGNKKLQLYVAVDNLLDRAPPLTPNDPNTALAYFFVPTRTEIYDFLGRSFRVGFRARF